VNTHARTAWARRGFTLIEILIVVVILGLLAGIVVAQFVGVSDDVEKQAFMTSGRIFTEASVRFFMDNGVYPEDSSSGALPSGFGYYITHSQWLGGTPIGGVWDSENTSFGYTHCLGVHFNGAGITRNDAYMQEIDAVIDDGNLGTGFFRKIAGSRYYFIIAP